jgi:hypothetical protein
MRGLRRAHNLLSGDFEKVEKGGGQPYKGRMRVSKKVGEKVSFNSKSCDG